MEKEVLYELIAAYLDDALPADKRREFEQRMAADPDFREEVELHRALQEDYAEPARWRLREALTEIMNEPQPPEPSSPAAKSSWKWWFSLPIVAFLGVCIWFFKKTEVAPQAPVVSPPTEILKITPLEKQPETQPTHEKTTSQPTTPVEKPNRTSPIAQADPARFQENRALEAYIGETRSVEDSILVEVIEPKNGSVFHPNEKGVSTLQFSGAAICPSPRRAFSLELQIFDNRDSRNAKRTLLFSLKTDNKGKATFDVRERVDFPKGLYYFRIGEKESGQRLLMGKFFIGQL